MISLALVCAGSFLAMGEGESVPFDRLRAHNEAQRCRPELEGLQIRNRSGRFVAQHGHGGNATHAL